MMPDTHPKTARVFKTGWFSKAARKAGITDEELCSAVSQVQREQANDLGGGVYKKRLRKNQYRSLILSKAQRFWPSSICSPNRIERTLTMMNWLPFAIWQRHMHDSQPSR